MRIDNSSEKYKYLEENVGYVAEINGNEVLHNKLASQRSHI